MNYHEMDIRTALRELRRKRREDFVVALMGVLFVALVIAIGRIW